MHFFSLNPLFILDNFLFEMLYVIVHLLELNFIQLLFIKIMQVNHFCSLIYPLLFEVFDVSFMLLRLSFCFECFESLAPLFCYLIIIFFHLVSVLRFSIRYCYWFRKMHWFSKLVFNFIF
jgi:hypothetical protein